MADPSITIDANTAAAHAKLKALRKELLQLGKNGKVNVLLGANLKEARQTLKKFREQVRNQKTNLPIDVKLTDARTNLKKFRQQIRSQKTNLPIDVNTSTARTNLKKLRQQIRSTTTRMPVTTAATTAAASGAAAGASTGGGAATGGGRGRTGGGLDFGRLSQTRRPLDFGQLGRSTSNAADSMRDLNRAASSLAPSLSRVEENFTTLLKRMRVLSFLTGTTIASIVSMRQELAGLAAVAGGVLVNLNIEPARDRLESVSQTAEGAKNRLDALRETASDNSVVFARIATEMADFTSRMESMGVSFASARSTVDGFIQAQSALGISTQDISSNLETLTDLAGQQFVEVSELRDAISFTNNPVKVLASSFDELTAAEIRNEDITQRLSGPVLQRLADSLENRAGEIDGLDSVFARFTDTVTRLLQAFNQAGVIDSLMNSLSQLQANQAIVNAMRNLGQATSDVIDRIPNLVRTVVGSWNTIVNATSSLAGFLIGSAAGGVPGGVFGAIIGANESLRESVRTIVGEIGSNIATVITDFNQMTQAIAESTPVQALAGFISDFVSLRNVVSGAFQATLAFFTARAINAGITAMRAQITALSQSYTMLQTRVTAASTTLGRFRRVGSMVVKGFGGWIGLLASVGLSLGAMAVSSNRASNSMNNLSAAAATTKQEVSDFSKRVRQLTGDYKDLEEAQLSQALAKGELGLATARQEALEARSEIRDLRSELETMPSEDELQTRGTRQMRKQVKETKEELREQKEQLRQAKQAIDTYANGNEKLRKEMKDVGNETEKTTKSFSDLEKKMIDVGQFDRFENQISARLENISRGFERLSRAEKDAQKDEAGRAINEQIGQAAGSMRDLERRGPLDVEHRFPISRIEQQKEELRGLRKVAVETGRVVSDSLGQGLSILYMHGNEGEKAQKAWKRLGDTIVNQLIRIATQAFVTNNIVNAITGAFTGGPTNLGDIGGAPMPGGNPAAQVANDGAFENGVQKMASGGIVDKPTVFPMQNGAGLMGEAGAEGVLPLERVNGKLGVNANTGGGGVKVEVINENNSSGAENDTEARQRSDGTVEIRNQIRDVVAEDIAKGGNTAKTIERTFGVKRKGRTR